MMENAATNKQTTERYAHVDTADVLQRVLRIGVERGFHVDRTSVTHRRKGTLHTVRIRFTALSGTGKNQGHPELVIVNSYNGESSLRFYLGFFRMICSNGLTIPMPGMEEATTNDKKRHLKGPAMDGFTRHLDERICAAFEGLANINSRFDAMAVRTINREQEATIIDQLSLSKKQLETLATIRMGKYGRDYEMNLWSLYNAVNEAMRITSRSEFSNQEHNFKLLPTIEEAAAHANVA